MVGALPRGVGDRHLGGDEAGVGGQGGGGLATGHGVILNQGHQGLIHQGGQQRIANAPLGGGFAPSGLLEAGTRGDVVVGLLFIGRLEGLQVAGDQGRPALALPGGGRTDAFDEVVLDGRQHRLAGDRLPDPGPDPRQVLGGEEDARVDARRRDPEQPVLGKPLLVGGPSHLGRGRKIPGAVEGLLHLLCRSENPGRITDSGIPPARGAGQGDHQGQEGKGRAAVQHHGQAPCTGSRDLNHWSMATTDAASYHF